MSEEEDRQLEIVRQLPEIMQLTAIRDELCGRNEDLASRCNSNARSTVHFSSPVNGAVVLGNRSVA